MKVVQVHSNLLDPGCRWAHPDIPSWPTADVMIANSHSCVYGSKASMAVNSVLLGLLLQSQAIRFKGMRICNLQFSGSPIPSVNVGAVQSKIPLHDRKDVHSPQQHTTRAFSILCHLLKIFSGRNLFITPSQMLTNMNPTSNLHNRPRLRAIYNLHSNSRRLAGLYDEGSLQGYIITVVTTEIKSAQSPITGRFFGKKKGQQLDPIASLPGGGFRAIHNK
eukprot:scaffold42691_cov78-Cyclotella_meneghiniana.AAC.5